MATSSEEPEDIPVTFSGPACSTSSGSGSAVEVCRLTGIFPPARIANRVVSATRGSVHRGATLTTRGWIPPSLPRVSERRRSVPFRDPTLRPIGVARQIDRKIHATVYVTSGRGEEPAHPAPGRAASLSGRRTRNEPSEDQPPIGIERSDFTEGLDRTTFVVHRNDDATVVGSIRKEHELHRDPHLRGTRLLVGCSTLGQRHRDEQERQPTRPRLPIFTVASTPRVLDDLAFNVAAVSGRRKGLQHKWHVISSPATARCSLTTSPSALDSTHGRPPRVVGLRIGTPA